MRLKKASKLSFRQRPSRYNHRGMVYFSIMTSILATGALVEPKISTEKIIPTEMPTTYEFQNEDLEPVLKPLFEGLEKLNELQLQQEESPIFRAQSEEPKN